MKKSNNDIVKALVMITQIGISIMVPIAFSLFIGYRLDRWLSTGYWIIIMIPVGILAAFKSIYQLTKDFYQKDLEKESKENQYMEELMKEGSENRERDARERDAK